MVDIELSGLSKRYGSHYAVDNIDLTIPSGAFVTLLGPSGCGKTTTLRSIAGLEEPDGGAIRIGERTMVDVAARVFVQPERRKVGMVFQSYALWPHLTVAQNIAYPLKRQRRSQPAIDKEVDRILELVGLSSKRDRSVAALSGGQQQRVALGRAMVGDPALTLFDEPLSNLDVKLRGRMRTEIRTLHDRVGMTSIYVTHDQEEALALSDIVVVMNEGKVQQVGTSQEIFFRPTNGFVADFVGYENKIPVSVISGTGGEVRLRAGQDVEFTATADVAPGNLAHAYTRPSAVRLSPAPGFIKILDGEVVARTYLGTSFEYQLISNGEVLIGWEPAAYGARPRFAPGDAASVYVDTAQAVILPAEDAAGRCHVAQPLLLDSVDDAAVFPGLVQGKESV